MGSSYSLPSSITGAPILTEVDSFVVERIVTEVDTIFAEPKVADWISIRGDTPRGNLHERNIGMEEIMSDATAINSAPSHCTIHRVVPNSVLKMQFQYPSYVSLGPLHFPYFFCVNEEMEKLKSPFNSDLLAGCSKATKGRLAFEMNKLEDEIRSRYSENTEHIDPEEFVSMMIRDGCFLIQLFRRFANSHNVAEDLIFSTSWLLPNLRFDVLLFENQTPWIVLERVFEIIGLEKEGYSLIDLALKFCNPLLPRQDKFLNKYSESNPKPDHLLSLFHATFISNFEEKQLQSESAQQQQSVEDDPHFIPCVADLQEAGVKFKKRENNDLLDIAFENGIPEMPPLVIDENTGLVFQNFLAYEQCNGSLKPYFTHYVSFMNNLVSSSKDVEILFYEGIISHSLTSDEEVVELFNKLCREFIHEVNSNYLYI